MTRKKFLQLISLSLGVLLLAVCFFDFRKRKRKYSFTGAIVGGASKTGHQLRDKKFNSPQTEERYPLVIVGGGISGLSAARWIKSKGVNDFILLDLEDRAGGNAVGGRNEVSGYPWGAHYLPVPNLNQKNLLEFLFEHGVITGYNEEGLPTYNEYYLCFDPEERLYINGYWQEGLIPDFGLTTDDKKQFSAFLALMQEMREAVGKDGKEAFAIPLDESSTDENFIELDKISMQAYLKNKNLNSPFLNWYVNYCCRDDFGTTIEKTSAWAGVHYFAARKGKGSNAEHHNVLTWPEGNGWLVNALEKNCKGHIRTQSLVYNIKLVGESVNVDYYDVAKNVTKRIIADKVICAGPQFINERIISPDTNRNIRNAQDFTYSPWMIANITVSDIPQVNGQPLSWDNVIYNSESLGYVNACHQHLSFNEKKKVLTYYFPLTGAEPKTAREAAYFRSYDDWVDIIVKDLSVAHFEIEKYIEHLDVWLWGHGMIRPLCGFISGTSRKEAQKPVADRIFFAHSDLSGISIFEEAFHHGIRAAEETLKNIPGK